MIIQCLNIDPTVGLVNQDATGEVWGICSDASGNCDYFTYP